MSQRAFNFRANNEGIVDPRDYQTRPVRDSVLEAIEENAAA